MTAWSLSKVVDGQVIISVCSLSPDPVVLTGCCKLGTISGVDLCSALGREVELRTVGGDAVEVWVRQCVQSTREYVWPVDIPLHPDQFAEEECKQIVELLWKHQEVFSRYEEDYGRTDNKVFM